MGLGLGLRGLGSGLESRLERLQLALRRGRRLGRGVAPEELGEALLDDGRPEDVGRRVMREARLAVGAARQPVVDEHHLPVVRVRIRVRVRVRVS